MTIPRRITIHWTAGTYVATDYEKQFYHFLVDGDGEIHPGDFKPEDNCPAPGHVLRSGKYAEHCGGGNSYNIGIGICGMHGFRHSKAVGPYPLTRKQCEAAWRLVAELAMKYDIPVDKDHVFTHREYGKRYPRSSSAGKIDICHLPYEPKISQEKVGDYIRNKVIWYSKRIDAE